MPFLQPSTANETDETANIVGGSYSLYYCVYGCMSITDTIIRSIHRQSQPGPTPSTPHILQLVAWIWIHSDQHRLRICALEALGGSPDLDTDLVPSLRAPPPLQHTDMLATLCRDLADRAVRDGPLCTAYRLLRVLLPVRASGTVDIAPAVFARVLAAYRRQHCAGAPDPVWRARVSHWHFFYVACVCVRVRAVRCR
ncbi:hypothetical protein PsYK624_063990 [Phanerochaete sordida]|uniref:Uncharacterized protein n=1 Tax=Phanerochaete sordida TaxID=48140 RepID=A0A9P3GA96_9APHY|nr:hypothetical protein PsYK624_063990 [Phanerochaete sordida]